MVDGLLLLPRTLLNFATFYSAEIKSQNTPNTDVQMYWTPPHESESEARLLTPTRRLGSGSPRVPARATSHPEPLRRNSTRTWEFWILIVPGDNAWVTTWP